MVSVIHWGSWNGSPCGERKDRCIPYIYKVFEMYGSLGAKFVRLVFRNPRFPSQVKVFHHLRLFARSTE